MKSPKAANRGFKKESETLKRHIVRWTEIVKQFPNNPAYTRALAQFEQRLAELNTSIGASK
jgi:hypothetical protein